MNSQTPLKNIHQRARKLEKLYDNLADKWTSAEGAADAQASLLKLGKHVKETIGAAMRFNGEPHNVVPWIAARHLAEETLTIIRGLKAMGGLSALEKRLIRFLTATFTLEEALAEAGARA